MMQRAIRGLLLACALFVSVAAIAQTLYKYRGDDGEWIYTDVPRDDREVEETRELATGQGKGGFVVSAFDTGPDIGFVAINQFFAPVEVKLRFRELEGMKNVNPDDDLTWVVPARSRMELIKLDKLQSGAAPSVRYNAQYMIGDPEANHRAGVAYRVPFGIASDFVVSQAYPDNETHRTADSRYAVDIAMPIGTDVFAARGGVVFDVSSSNFSGGTNLERDAKTANVVQILHDDGSFAVYAHLNWNSIRVQPGERIERGQYIADSGNTGFSSGPHLHFAVLVNRGFETVSVPVQFEGANASRVIPATGALLTAY